MHERILSICDLKTYFPTRMGVVKAVDGISLEVNAGEIFGMVGETGCGKTLTALSVLRLIPTPGKIVSGEIIFRGENLVQKSEEELRKIRGSQISMIFQDPMASLNPSYTIGDQVAEVIRLHQNASSKEVVEKTEEMLGLVGLPTPPQTMKKYPHELSGGMRQRVMIAIALSCKPSLLMADEPTTLLDVTIQAQILELMKGLQEEMNTSILWITHNLGVVAEICDRVAVMYAGTIVECADVCTILDEPSHPYTMGLIKSVPKLGKITDSFETIPGAVPDPLNLPSGCKFHPRCQYAKEVCVRQRPNPVETGPGHFVSCLRASRDL